LTEEEIRDFLTGKANGETEVKRVQFPDLKPVKTITNMQTSISHLEDIEVEISVELGHAEQKVREILSLTEGSIIKLKKTVGDPVEVLLNQQRFATGEVVIINDSFSVRIGEINQLQNASLNEELL
jgi:flagellar motor switch protein FliN/FliY